MFHFVKWMRIFSLYHGTKYKVYNCRLHLIGLIKSSDTATQGRNFPEKKLGVLKLASILLYVISTCLSIRPQALQRPVNNYLIVATN